MASFTYAAQPTGTDLISLNDIKEFLRVDSTDEDTTITALLESAVQSIQDYTGRHFKTSTFVYTIDNFSFVEFPYQVTSISSVTYLDTTGATTTLSADNYSYDTARQPGRLKFIGTLPDLQGDKFNRITINGTVNAILIEGPLLHAIKMLTAHFYENRRAVVVGATANEVPLGIQAISNPYRIINVK